MVKFIEVTHSRTGRLTRVNADKIIRVVTESDGKVVFDMEGGDIIPVDNTWSDIDEQLKR